MHRVVITGMGALTPIGNKLSSFWEHLIQGKSGAAPITRFRADAFKTQFACELKDFDLAEHIPPSESRKYDRFTSYALVAAEEAIQQACIEFDRLNRNRIGVIWGSGNGGIETFGNEMIDYVNRGETSKFNPFFIPKIIADIASGVISMRYGLHGANFSTISACATSTTALIEAFNYIRWGKQDMVITGGSEAPITIAGIGGFNAARALSTRNDEYQTASRPFDISRDGFVMGEGAGALVLESLAHAKARGATILGEMVGGGMAADAYHLTGTHPEGKGAILGMQEALHEAEISPESIDYVNMHATSTPIGDLSELKALETVFCNNKDFQISATKSMTGHLLGAAGAIEAIASIMAIRENIVPPTMNTQEIDGAWADRFNFTLGKAEKRPVHYAMSNTFGFGGHIATAIFKKYEN